MYIDNYYKVGYLEEGDSKLPRNILVTTNRRGFVYHNGISRSETCFSYEISDLSFTYLLHGAESFLRS